MGDVGVWQRARARAELHPHLSRQVGVDLLRRVTGQLLPLLLLVIIALQRPEATVGAVLHLELVFPHLDLDARLVRQLKDEAHGVVKERLRVRGQCRNGFLKALGFNARVCELCAGGPVRATWTSDWTSSMSHAPGPTQYRTQPTVNRSPFSCGCPDRRDTSASLRRAACWRSVSAEPVRSMLSSKTLFGVAQYRCALLLYFF